MKKNFITTFGICGVFMDYKMRATSIDMSGFCTDCKDLILMIQDSGT